MRKLTLFALTTLTSSSTFAATNNTVFSCTATDGNPITVTQVGDDYEFSYGNTTFKNPIKRVVANQDSYVSAGSGFTTNSLQLKNNGYSYTIEFVQPQNAPNTVNDPRLYIERGNKMDTVQCDTGKEIHQNLDTRIMRTSP